MKLNKNQIGFTLVELLVAMACLGFVIAGWLVFSSKIYKTQTALELSGAELELIHRFDMTFAQLNDPNYRKNIANYQLNASGAVDPTYNNCYLNMTDLTCPTSPPSSVFLFGVAFTDASIKEIILGRWDNPVFYTKNGRICSTFESAPDAANKRPNCPYVGAGAFTGNTVTKLIKYCYDYLRCPPETTGASAAAYYTDCSSRVKTLGSGNWIVRCVSFDNPRP